MKPALFAVVLGLGIGMMGCAAGVEDPLPPAPAPEEQRDPPKQTLSAELRDPQQQLMSGIAIDNGFSEVPIKQGPAGPLPTPER